MVERQLSLDFSVQQKHPEPIELLTADELYNSANQTVLSMIYEDRRFERKSAGIHQQPFAEYFSMWANTAPDGGLIVAGIEDNGSIEGCKRLLPSQLNELENAGYDRCRDARYSSKRLSVTNKNGEPDFVVLFRVQYHETKVVELPNGDAFWRKGDKKVRLSSDEKRLLQLDKGQVTLEQEPCGLTWPDAFDQRAIRKFTDSVQRSGRDLITSLPDHQILTNHKLGKLVNGNFIPNIACALLFANDPREVIPGCMIRFQRYEGNAALTGRDRNVVKDEEFSGRIPEMIQVFTEFLRGQLREFSRLGKDGKFFTSPEYPSDAWYEAIVNACVHRSYSLPSMNIFVKMFDDRLVVESPGPFPPLVTPENIYEVHHRRNFWLMDAMRFLDFVRCENESLVTMGIMEFISKFSRDSNAHFRLTKTTTDD